MSWTKQIGLAVITILMIQSLGLAGETARYLWNVNEDGDTLQYINLFHLPDSGLSLDYPRYIRKPELNDIITAAGFTKDSVQYISNLYIILQVSSKVNKKASRLQPSYENIWAPVLAISISGAVSAYYKLEANNAYERYNKSIDRAQIQKYYDLTREYDTYSAISFVFLQASFGWLTYKLLW